MAAASFDREAYAHFHFVIFGHELPAHCKVWVDKMFEQYSKKGIRGLLNKASRGFTKSTVAIGFALFCHGHFPEKSGLIAQARDADAKRTAKFMSDTIAQSKGWKAAFPNVVPDNDRGWSLDGYYIKDVRVPYDEWVKRTSGDHGRDPSFMAVSIISGSIGMHPTLYLMLDDIHDQKNTASEAERIAIRKTLTADVLPTMSNPAKSPFLCVSYTPWADDDAYVDPLEKSGIFEKIVTPAFRYDSAGKDEWDGNKITLTWPEFYTVKVLQDWRDLLGKREFGRMFLCDLEVGKGQSLRYYTYGQDAISYDWPTVGGADPTNVISERHEDIKKRSYFALAYLAKIPQGGAVVVDGVLEPCSQLEAENYIMRAQSLFPNWLFTRVEKIGGGSGFIQTLMRNPRAKIIDSDLSDLNKRNGRVKKKEDRINIELSPWFENGVIRISDADTPFLRALRRGFDKFYELPPNDPAWDAMDAVYHAAKGIPDVLVIGDASESLPSLFRKSRSVHPLTGMRK
jgi:hypothetical protein